MREALGWGSLAILLALILWIGAMAAGPGLGCANSLKGNSTAALATLSNLVSGQARFQVFSRCDLDGDGVGEFGTFGELTGAAGIRADPAGGSRSPPLQEPILSPALAGIDGDGIVTKSGYAFRIFLPAKGGGACHEGRAGAPFDRPVDSGGAGTSWCAYAWPVGSRETTHRVFFATGRGTVLAAENDDLRYFGKGSAPAWDAAFPAGTGNDWIAPPEGIRYLGRDGSEWRPVN